MHCCIGPEVPVIRWAIPSNGQEPLVPYLNLPRPPELHMAMRGRASSIRDRTEIR